MTREEAIKELSYIADEMPSMECVDWIKAISMAIKALEQEPCDDCISRQATLAPYKVLKDTDTLCVALIRANIMQQPSVKQDTVPFDIELYQAGLMDMPKEMIDVLDKIRAEIIDEKDAAYADFEQYKVDYLGVDAEYVEDELPQDDFRYGMERAIEIIDKYRKESEE